MHHKPKDFDIFNELFRYLTDEGELRNSFEDFIKSLKAVRYSLERDEHKEYKNPAVFHMWSGYCIAQAVYLT